MQTLLLDLLEHMHLLLLRLIKESAIAYVLVVLTVVTQLQVDEEEFQDVLLMFVTKLVVVMVHFVSSVLKVEMEPYIVGLVI
tara:strand:- start:301 stop:546 length:246 start_codon:yes stop_codon:yes gene_type:complete